MPLNATIVLRNIFMELGASHQQLELDQEDIIKTVEEITVPTFSHYFPHEDKQVLAPDNDGVPGSRGLYYVRSDFEVLGVKKVLINNIEAGVPNISGYFSDPISMQIQANIDSAWLNPVTFKFHSPDIVEIFPKNTLIRQMLVVLKVMHAKHLGTIRTDMREEFLKLAVLDVKRALYPIRKRFQTIGTTFGNIEPFIEQLENARQDREDLLDKWKTEAPKSSQKQKLFIY